MAPRDPPDDGPDLTAFNPEALAADSERKWRDRDARGRRARWVVVDGGASASDGDREGVVAPADGSGRPRGK